jgi:uncharacterized protein YbjT (DUF2867 family)
MGVLVLGASERTGGEVVDLALLRGHHVTAFGRSPEEIGQISALLRVVRGDPPPINQTASR